MHAFGAVFVSLTSVLFLIMPVRISGPFCIDPQFKSMKRRCDVVTYGVEGDGDRTALGVDWRRIRDMSGRK